MSARTRTDSCGSRALLGCGLPARPAALDFLGTESMPRAKAAPTRNNKRPLEEEDPAALVAQVVAGAEAAEIANVRERISSGACALHKIGDKWPSGLVRLGAIASEDLETFTTLHTTICSRLGARLTGWGGVGDKSGRLRGYGYVPNSDLAAAHSAEGHVMKEYEGSSTAQDDRAANRLASIQLSPADMPPDFDQALERLLEAIRPQVDERYRAVLFAEKLVAAQPNLHRGKAYLRPHLDEPLHDGFGVVIVTIAIDGDATILVRSARKVADESPPEPAPETFHECCFPLARGEAYALSGDARNICLHGVLANEASAARESLNLRFGLHSREVDGELSAWEEVQRHWPAEEPHQVQYL